MARQLATHAVGHAATWSTRRTREAYRRLLGLGAARDAPDWQYGLPFVHEIWVPSRFTADAVQSIAAGRPVRVLPHPVADENVPRLPPRRAEFRAPQSPFTVLTIFNAASTFARKNPLASIEAFRRAFGNDPTALLIIKTSSLSVFPEGRKLLTESIGQAANIVLVDATQSASEIAELYSKADVVLSLHRSEGFGLTIAEAMLRALPVVATNWSGNVDFVTADTGIPVPYRLIPASDPQGTYHHPDMLWAQADVEAAATALQRLRADPQLRRRLGQAAAHFAVRIWSAEKYGVAVRSFFDHPARP